MFVFLIIAFVTGSKLNLINSATFAQFNNCVAAKNSQFAIIKTSQLKPDLQYLPLWTPCWNVHLMPLQEHAFWLLRRESLELGSMPFLSPPLASEWTTIPLGLQLASGSDPIGVAAGLRLGSPLCRPPHTCHHSGTEVDSLATHGLSCRWSEGRHHRHATVNDIVHRALSSARFPHDWSPLASTTLTGNVQMASQLCPGKTASCWCGMRRAPTPLHPPTLPLLPTKQELWLPRLK